MRVGGQEVVAVHLDIDLAGKQGIVATDERRFGDRGQARERVGIGAIERDLCFAIADDRRHTRLLMTSLSLTDRALLPASQRARSPARRRAGAVAAASERRR